MIGPVRPVARAGCLPHGYARPCASRGRSAGSPGILQPLMAAVDVQGRNGGAGPSGPALRTGNPPEHRRRYLRLGEITPNTCGQRSTTLATAAWQPASTILGKTPFIGKVREVVASPPAGEGPLPLRGRENADTGLDRSQPVPPTMPGVPERRSHDYVGARSTTFFAALEVASGKVIG